MTKKTYFCTICLGRVEALRRLGYEKPNHQICLLSQTLIDSRLTFITAEEL